MEPMEEVNYSISCGWLRFDHPENVEVNPDEKFLDDPPFASGRVVASEGARLPVNAWDGEGRDVLVQVAGAITHSPVASRRCPTMALRIFTRSHSLRRGKAGRSAAAADDRLRKLLQRDFAVCRVAGGIKPIRLMSKHSCPMAHGGASRTMWDSLPDWSARSSEPQRQAAAGARRIRLMTNLEFIDRC